MKKICCCTFFILLFAPLLQAAPDYFFPLGEYETEMTEWSVHYDEIVSLESLGKSFENREIYLLKISNNVEIEEDKPEILLLSLQHAREWLSGMTLYGIADFLITQYGENPEVTNLLDSLEIYVLLVANPDGYAYSYSNDRLWRKNRKVNGDGTYGVDLNRNWEYQWQIGPSTSSNAYGGPSALSEPETQALRGWLLSPGRNLVGCLNYNSFGQDVMYNWAYTQNLPDNMDYMEPLAREVAQAIESVSGSKIQNGPWSIVLDFVASSGGVMEDYFNSTLGIPTLTIETRPEKGTPNGFEANGDDIELSISEHIPGALNFLNWAMKQGNDQTSPLVSNFSLVGLSNTEAIFSWKTDEGASAKIEYGQNGFYDFSFSGDNLKGTSHKLKISDLNPDSEYQAQAVAQNLAGIISSSSPLTFTTAETPQSLVPPKYPAILSITQSGESALKFEWDHLSTTGTGGYRIYESTDSLSWNIILSNLNFGITTHPYSVSKGLRYYYMTSIDEEFFPNESIPSDVYAFSISEGTQNKTLIVDGYDYWNDKPISGGKNHSFAAWHGKSLSKRGTSFDTCANQVLGDIIFPASYENIIWVLGDESVRRNTFNETEQNFVKEFLQIGGNLFVTGSRIGYDLDSQGGANDRFFYNQYLKSDFQSESTGIFDVSGTKNWRVLGTDSYHFDYGGRGIYRVEKPDSITPLGNAWSVLESPDGKIFGVQYFGTFPEGTKPAKLLYLTIPLETFYPEQTRNKIMNSVFKFFEAKQDTPIWIAK